LWNYNESRRYEVERDVTRNGFREGMRKRRYLCSTNSNTKVFRIEQDALSPRSFVVACRRPFLNPATIAAALRQIQQDLGPPTHVYGLYVIGVGFFHTVPIDSPSDPMYRIGGWTGRNDSSDSRPQCGSRLIVGHPTEWWSSTFTISSEWIDVDRVREWSNLCIQGTHNSALRLLLCTPDAVVKTASKMSADTR